MEPRAAAVSFQDEFRIGFFKRTDWYFLLVVAAIFTVYALIVAIMSTFPVPETTDEDIRALQRKVATMVFNIPVERTTPSEKARAAAPVKTPTTLKDKAADRVKQRATGSAMDRETARSRALAARRAERAKAEAAVSTMVRSLVMLTAVDDGTEGGEQVEDLIGQGGIKSANLGKVLTGLDGLRNDGHSQGRDQRYKRGTDGLTAGRGVEDLITGITGPQSKSLSRKTSVVLSKPQFEKGSNMKSAHRDIEAINKAIQRKLGAIQYCYKKQLRRDPGLSGKVTVTFTIAPTGRITQSRVIQSDIRDAGLEQCLLKTIRMLQFEPIDPSEGSMSVTYPFVFAG